MSSRNHAAVSPLRESAAKSGLIQNGDRILVCVSGGADSVALLHFLAFSMRDFHLSLVACHFHHGLRGADADADAAFVRELCISWNIPYVIGRGNVKREAESQKQGIEAAARTLRYRFFLDTANRCHCNKIATAHTLDDQAETVVLRLLRGSGGAGLRGILPKNNSIIRPLLGVTRQQVEEYLAAFSIPHREDASNHTDDYTRNRVRRHILPLLKEENPSIAETLGKTAESLRLDEEYLSSQTDKLFRESRCAEGYRLDSLKESPEPLLRRFALRLLAEQGVSGNEKVLQLVHIIRAGQGRLPVGESEFTAERGLLFLADSATILPFCLAISELPATLPDGRTVDVHIITDKNGGNCEKIHKNALFPPLDCDKIQGIAKIHSRRGGETIALRGRGVTKSVKKLCQEGNIPLGERGRLCLLSDEAGVLAVERFGVSERAACTDETTRALCVFISQ